MADKPAEFNNPEFANDGEINSELDGAGKRRLLVSDLGNNDSSATPGCAVVSKKMRVEFDDTDVDISSAFVTVFTYSGSGKLFSASIKFNGEDINLRLKIDSEIIFNLNAKDVKDHQSNNRSTAVNIFNQNTGLWTIDFFCPIVFATSVLFEAQTSSGGDKTMERLMIALSKET